MYIMYTYIMCVYIYVLYIHTHIYRSFVYRSHIYMCVYTHTTHNFAIIYFPLPFSLLNGSGSTNAPNKI